MFVEGMVAVTRDRLVMISQDAPLIEAAELLGNANADLVVVCGPDGCLSGVVTKTDVVRQISHCQGASCTAAVSAVMTEDVTACQPADQVSDVWAIMKKRHLKNIPVTDAASVPIGILNARDALQVLLTEVENEEALLRDYVMSVGYR